MLPGKLRAAAAAFLFASVVTLQSAVADEIRMKNGDVLRGEIIKKETDRVIFKTTYAGEIPIKWAEVANVVTEKPIQVVLADGSKLRGQMVETEPGKIVLEYAEEAETRQVDFPLAQMQYLNPTPDLTGDGIRWSGNMNAGATLTSGNTDTRLLRFDAESVVRALDQRFTVGGIFNRARDRGRDSLFNSRGYGKYDYFLQGKKWYLYANATLENDRFRDLRLRSVAGFGSGYQIFETPDTNLSLEGGPVYVKQDFYEEEDKDYPGLRWATRYDQLLLQGKVKFFHEHQVLLGLKQNSQTLIFSKTGLRFPLIFNFNATAQFNLDWDSSPAEGREREDATALFTLGYGW